jgi:putative ABC transport system substrate-binding protein
LKAAEAAARRFDIELQTLEYHNGNSLDEALKEALNGRSTSIVMLSSPIVSTNSKPVAEFMFRHRLPAISPFRNFPNAGGLMSYGPNVNDFYRRAAMYVDRILQGAKPAELPIQQPTKFELVINLKTAKALNLTIPPSVLARADDAIR